MSKYEVKLVNIGEEVDNRIRELEIEVKDIRKANDNLTRANESYRQENIEQKAEIEFLLKRNAEHEKHNKDRTYAILDGKIDSCLLYTSDAADEP